MHEVVVVRRVERSRDLADHRYRTHGSSWKARSTPCVR